MSTYSFIDSTTRTSSTYLPAEAMSLNGSYIENLVTGYRTLYTKGREMLSPSMDTFEVGIRDGGFYKNRKYPARVITIGYQLICASDSAFRTAYNTLNKVLNVENAQLIFADETDKYFIGTPSVLGDVEPGRNAVTGEFEILCTDPFKYSTTEYTATPTEDSGATFSISYDGTYPTYPVLETEFYKSTTKDDDHGECGFVAFANDRGKALQIGYVNEPDKIAYEVQQLVDATTTTWKASKTLINEPFNNLTSWSSNDGFVASSLSVITGSAKADYLSTGSTIKSAMANSYGATTNAQWHGPTIKRTAGSDGGSPAVSGAVDYRFHALFRMCANKTANTAKAEKGILQIFLLDNTNAFTTGISMWKNAGGTKGTIKIYLKGGNADTNVIKSWENVDFSYYNERFGWTDPNSTKKPPCNIDITKQGDKFTYDIGGLTFSFTSSALANKVTDKVSIFFGQWADVPAISYMGVYSCQFISDSVTKTKTTETWQQLTEYLEVHNTFTTNDLLIVDCSDGTIRVKNSQNDEDQDGGLRPELGALGNDWESFTLVPGTNKITTAYSDWVTNTYKPSFKLKYRKRYL